MANSSIDSAALAIKEIGDAAQALASGELVAFPTETVYGLGADACNDVAISKIFAAKGRPSDHPLIVHVANPSGAAHFAERIPAFAQKLIATFWPGPLTVILPRKAGVAGTAAGGQGSIGLRCPSHPMALSLLRACEKLGVQGVAAPSANRFGRVSPTSAAHVCTEFGAGLLVLDGGDCDLGIESTIVDCTRGAPVLLRPGVLTLKALEAACGERILLPQANTDKDFGDTPRASGTLESHYAPRAKVRIVSVAEVQKMTSSVAQAIYVLPHTAELAAHELFAVLRRLDETGVAEIFVSEPPQGEAWDGVRDRLTRAAA
jgi:L-threonylcarbamoyladenylate synthase